MEQAVVLLVEFGNQAATENIQVVPETITWEDLRLMLKVYSDHDKIHVCYFDEDSDEIIIESQEELNEAFKVAKKNNNTIRLLVRGEGSMTATPTKNQKDSLPRDMVYETCEDGIPSNSETAFYLTCRETGMVLDICGGSTRPNTQLILWPRKSMSEGVTNQLWYRYGATLRSLFNGYCIDIADEKLVVNPYDDDKVTQQWTVQQWTLYTYHNRHLKVGVSGAKHAGVPVKVSSSANKIAPLEWKVETEPRISAEPYRRMHIMEDQTREMPPLYSACGYPFPYPFPKQPSNPAPSQMATEEPVHHRNVVCDVCDKEIFGIRYKCGYCNDFDLCESCESKPGVHDPAHILLKIREPLYCVMDPLKMATVPPISCPRRAYKPEVIGPALLRSRGIITAHPGVVEYTETNKHNMDTGAESRQAEAEFEGDETIPDGTHVDPGATLLKKWRVRNVGTAPWASKTVLRHIDGDMQYRRSEVSVPYVESGFSGTVVVELVAPRQPGNYESRWKLFNHGKAFGPDLWCCVIVEEKKLETAQDESTGEKDNEAVDTTPGSASLPSTPANTPLAVTPPYTPTIVKMAPLFAACQPDEEDVRDETANSIEKNEVNSDADKNEELKAVVHVMQEMSSLTINDLDDAADSVDSASDTETDDFYIVPIPDCFNMSLPMRKEASTTVIVKKEDAARSSYAGSSVGEDETSAVWLPPPPVRFMNKDQDSDSDLDSFSEMESDLCETRSVSSVESLEDITVVQLQASAVDTATAAAASETNDLNKTTAAASAADVEGAAGVIVSNNIEEEEEYRTAAMDGINNPAATEQQQQQQLQELRDDSGAQAEGRDDTVEEAEEATERSTAAASSSSNEQPRTKNDLEDMAYDLMATTFAVAKKAASAAFCTAKDVYHTLQARNSYSPPRSTWTPPENTWTPPASTWTPVQPTWSPSEQQWVQPETTSPALDQIASDQAYIPPQVTPSAPQTPSPMQQLIEMGFGNREMNARVLEAFDNDIEAAVQELLHQEDNTQWYHTRH